MSIVAEICTYLIIVLGIICATITFCSNYNFKMDYCIRNKKNGTNVLVDVRFIGLSDNEIQDISYALANGQFRNIYDLVDEFKVYKKD